MKDMTLQEIFLLKNYPNEIKEKVKENKKIKN